MSLFNMFNISSGAMTAQSMRLNTVASNLANADSIADANGQPYKAKQVVFQAITVGGREAQGVKVKEVVESAAPHRMQYDPRNPAANADGYVTMPNVNVVEEMVNMISASRSYQTNADVMNTAKTLLLRTLSIGQ